MIRGYSVFKVFMGSFFIQGSWSFEKMQSLGFAAAVSPGLKDISEGDALAMASLQRRHMAFYNAHPYMASPVLGAALNIEELSSRGALDSEAASRFKKKVMAPYGAVGDGFFWGSLRPMASCAGAATALIWGMWGPLLFLVIYNIFHLWMRWKGLKMGLELGEGVAGYIKSLNLTEWGIRAKYSALAFTGAFTALTAARTLSYVSPGEAAARASWLAVLSAAFLLSVILLAELFKRGFRVERLVYLFIPPLILYGVISF